MLLAAKMQPSSRSLHQLLEVVNAFLQTLALICVADALATSKDISLVQQIIFCLYFQPVWLTLAGPWWTRRTECDGHSSEPATHDMGILASTDQMA